MNIIGDTALMRAVYRGHIACVDSLLRAGASKDQKNIAGRKFSLVCHLSL